MTHQRSRLFDPARHELREGVVYERVREELDGRYRRVIWLRVGVLGWRETSRDAKVITREQVVVED